MVESNFAVQTPTLYVTPHLFGDWLAGHLLDCVSGRRQARQAKEDAAVVSFAARINAFGPLSGASPSLQTQILEQVMEVARHINTHGEIGAESGYGRRVLYEYPGHWSLAAISLRPGQQTELHDHGGWGCAVTVQGVERNRIFAHDAPDNPALVGERDYPRGTGYVFDSVEVHQPLGADPNGVTIALHFLVHEDHAQAHAEVTKHQPEAA
ncbi:MAG TPA: hypothetical protein VFR15_10710 [Chloroflexia bacterium]|nr:hypothetical protein [Chloroflexia bacterium]